MVLAFYISITSVCSSDFDSDFEYTESTLKNEKYTIRASLCKNKKRQQSQYNDATIEEDPGTYLLKSLKNKSPPKFNYIFYT
jgi:hypothetical protein